MKLFESSLDKSRKSLIKISNFESKLTNWLSREMQIRDRDPNFHSLEIILGRFSLVSCNLEGVVSPQDCSGVLMEPVS